MSEEKKMTGYPSIDKPWLKFYSEEAINTPLPKCTIYEYLYENNKDHLDDKAINYYGNKISYGELFKNINILANTFIRKGVQCGDSVAVCLPSMPEAVYAIYALNLIGAIPNMLDPRYNEKLLSYCMDGLNAKIIITYDGCYEKLLKMDSNSLPEIVVLVSPLLSAPLSVKLVASLKIKKITPQASNHVVYNDFVDATFSKVKNPVKNRKLDECAVIIHTGGTTGNPKGVMLSNNSINSIAHQYKMLVNPQRGETLLDIIPPFASYGLCTSIHMPLSFGLTIDMIPKFDADEFGDLLHKHKPNYVMGVPNFYEGMITNKKLIREDMSYLISAACGGDSMSTATEEKINTFLVAHNSKAKIDMGYGMSEVSATAGVCFGQMHSYGSVGVPFVKTEFKIVNPDNSEELSYNQIGEICISGPGMMVGYYNDDELTNKTIKIHTDGKKWVHTGDLGRIDEHGFLYHEGRIKRLIVRYDGFKIYPVAIEQVILKQDNVLSCAVVKGLVSGLGAVARAYIVLKDNKYDVLDDVLALCKKELAERSIPYSFDFVESLPLTSIGKIDYRALEKMAEEMEHKNE